MEVNRRRFLLNAILEKKAVISILSLILFVSVITYAVYETTKATVTVTVDGEKIVVQTHASTIADLMSEQEWDVKDYDVIEPSLDTEISGNMDVTWEKAKKVFVSIGGSEKSVWTTAETVKELIDELAIKYKKQDLVEPGLDEEIVNEMNFVYESAFQVELTSDGEQYEMWTTSTTVADFLERENVTLGELDRVEPGLEESIDKETDIQIIRVEKVTDVVEESVDFGTVTRKDDQLQSGKEKVLESGEKGRVAKYFEVIMEDGKEVSRSLLKTETVKESKDRIVAVGTKPIATNVSRSQSISTRSSENASRSGRTLTVTATAYTASCSGCSGVTATGVNLNNNRNMKVIAVDPNVIPLGSRVHVEGYGNAIAADTGGAIRGNKIDVHMPTKADASRWGRRTVKITILD